MPKRRVPKHNAPPIEITKPNQFNNGNIEVIQPQASSAVQSQNKVTVDEVLINGRRYRVPERVIMLDFWSKISSDHNPTQLVQTLKTLHTHLTVHKRLARRRRVRDVLAADFLKLS